MAIIKKITLPDNATHDIGCNTQNLSRPNGLRGVSDITIQSLISSVRANRLAFLPADQVIVEKTTDGGTTWISADISDPVKRNIFNETRGSTISLPLINGVRSILCGVRLTITAMKYTVPSGTDETGKYAYWNSNYVEGTERYCQLRDLYFFISSGPDSMSITVEAATGASPTSWITLFNDSSFYMTGWSGPDYIRLNSQRVFGGSKTQTGNTWNYRITFMTRGVNGTNTMSTTQPEQAQNVSEIRGYGDTAWTKPNEYMANDKLYKIDSDLNATFPAKVIANGSSLTNLNGSNISSGTVAEARIANLSAGKITSGTFETARLPSSGVTAGSYGPSDNAAPAFGGTFSVPYETVDAKGRVTAAATKTITIPNATATTTTDGLMSATDKAKLNDITTIQASTGVSLTEDTSGLIITFVT